ncbi:hypothetical protein STTU_3984 [Streptomyces sp. Tu6071]|nr:hypothetical protein STTU_3984 [Streptomyces sp. Tu6071]
MEVLGERHAVRLRRVRKARRAGRGRTGQQATLGPGPRREPRRAHRLRHGGRRRNARRLTRSESLPSAPHRGWPGGSFVCPRERAVRPWPTGAAQAGGVHAFVLVVDVPHGARRVEGRGAFPCTRGGRPSPLAPAGAPEVSECSPTSRDTFRAPTRPRSRGVQDASGGTVLRAALGGGGPVVRGRRP